MYQVYTNLAYVPPTYRKRKKYDFSLSIKTYVIPYLVETEMGFLSGDGTNVHIMSYRNKNVCYAVVINSQVLSYPLKS